MCIVGIAHLAASGYPLIVAANRDERHARPTAAATWWTDRPDILSGRDLLAGGTWLGINTNGRFAAVTNVFDGVPAPSPLSRGALVGNFLVSTVSAPAYIRSLAADRDRYGPYNLLVLDRTGLRYGSNRGSEAALAPGIHVYSNNQPGTDWPKRARLSASLQVAIDSAAGPAGAVRNADAAAADRASIVEDLLALLSGPAARGSRESAPDSIFVLGNEFGTRCSTVLVVGTDGEATFVERSFGPDGSPQSTRRYTFVAPAFATGR